LQANFARGEKIQGEGIIDRVFALIPVTHTLVTRIPDRSYPPLLYITLTNSKVYIYSDHRLPNQALGGKLPDTRACYRKL